MISKGAAVIVTDEKISGMWVCLRKKDGKWGAPGGRIEWKEDWLNGALRELKEETALERKNLGFLGVQSHKGLKTDMTIWFITQLLPNEKLTNAEPDKHEDWVFKTWEEAKQLDLMASTPSAIDKVLRTAF